MIKDRISVAVNNITKKRLEEFRKSIDIAKVTMERKEDKMKQDKIKVNMNEYDYFRYMHGADIEINVIKEDNQLEQKEKLISMKEFEERRDALLMMKDDGAISMNEYRKQMIKNYKDLCSVVITVDDDSK